MTRAAPSGRGPALEAVFKPVQPPTTFEETVERLGTAIRLGLLPPGTRLPPERELAEQLRISRSTLRQALTTLVQSGHLISLRGRAGRHVRRRGAAAGRSATGPPLGEEARAVLDYRVAVETGATVLAAERAERGRPRRLERLTEEMSAEPRAASFEVYRRADVRFHIGLAEACHSPRLVVAMTEVQGQMSDLIQRMSHPDEVLTPLERPAQAARGAAAPQGHRPRGAADARALRGHRAHPGRADAGLTLKGVRPP